MFISSEDELAILDARAAERAVVQAAADLANATVDFWSCEEGLERLTHDDIDSAVESWLENVEPAEWPDDLTVYAYVRGSVSEAERAAWTDELAERAMELWAEEHGDPDDDSGPSDALVAAARALVNLASARQSWTCAREHRFDATVNVADWVRADAAWANHHEVVAWLAERPAAQVAS